MVTSSPIPRSQCLSLEVFYRLVKTLPPDKISAIPVEKLPPNIPVNLTEKIPLASRQAVEGLLLAANSYYLSRQLKDQETYGEDVVFALDKARAAASSASIRVFKNKVLNLINLLEEHQRNKTEFRFSTFGKNLVSINDLLIDVRSEQKNILKTTEVLEKTTPANKEDKARFAEANVQLRTQFESIERLLGEYYLLRLKINTRVINAKRRQIMAQEQSIIGMQQELATLRGRLETSQTFWRRTLDRRHTKLEYENLQARITEVAQEINAKEVVISEQELTNWLDTIVDASLNPYSFKRISEPARQARIALYYLLNKFCSIQEGSALQIAQNPFLQVNPEEAIKFVLKSEQFILDYFANKKKDNTAWLSGAARARIADLDDMQKDILKELRRASKIHRK